MLASPTKILLLTKTLAIKYIEDDDHFIIILWVNVPLEDIKLLNTKDHGAKTIFKPLCCTYFNNILFQIR